MNIFSRITRWGYLAGEALTMKLVPKDRVNWLWKWIFKQPILLYKLGLGSLIGSQVLILTTIGRKTGKERLTPLGYTIEEESGTYYLTAGWDGRTDWFRNLQADPRFKVWVGRKRFEGLSRLVSEDEAVKLMLKYIHLNPFAAQLLPQMTGEAFDPTEEGLRRAVHHFPMVALESSRST